MQTGNPDPILFCLSIPAKLWIYKSDGGRRHFIPHRLKRMVSGKDTGGWKQSSKWPWVGRTKAFVCARKAMHKKRSEIHNLSLLAQGNKCLHRDWGHIALTHPHTHTGNFGLKIGLKVRKAYFCERGTKEGSGQKRGVGRDAEIGWNKGGSGQRQMDRVKRGNREGGIDVSDRPL